MTYEPVDVDLSGRVVVVTGANSGMGKETARELARLGAEVILACRSTERGNAAAQEIIATTGRTGVSTMALDLSSRDSVRAFATAFRERFPRLNVLVHNAAASLRTRQLTTEGFERQWATNVLGPHLLTGLLLPALQASGRGRIVTVSTVAAGGLDLADTQYEGRPYKGVAVYRATKQAGRMLTWALADQLRGTPVTANALSPGYVLTDLTRNAGGLVKIAVALTGFLAQSPLEGADTAIWLAASPQVEGISGTFWKKRHPVTCRFRDPAAIEELHALVEQQLGGGAPAASPRGQHGRSAAGG